MFKLPTKETIVNSKLIAWMGPSISHPSLWRWKRSSVSLGVAIGFFFGMLIPLAQIPLSAIFAVLLRANVGAAAMSTLISNPITFPGIYYAAYQFGNYFLGLFSTDSLIGSIELAVLDNSNTSLLDSILSTGKPVIIGLCCFAVAFGFLGYIVTNSCWGVKTRVRWYLRKRRMRRAS